MEVPKLSSGFAVSTQQFYAMFIGGGIKGDKKACSAYITRSTRGLRTLLQEQVRASSNVIHVTICGIH
jgi:hypothetical protein